MLLCFVELDLVGKFIMFYFLFLMMSYNVYLFIFYFEIKLMYLVIKLKVMFLGLLLEMINNCLVLYFVFFGCFLDIMYNI